MRFADLDAVTVDAFGTLISLVDPVPALAAVLRERGITCGAEMVHDAFAAEARYYRTHALTGRDPQSLAELRRQCTAVFLGELGAELDPAGFAPVFLGALRFEPVAGVDAVLARLRARGLQLAVVSNWDVSLRVRLRELGLESAFSTIVTSAAAGAEKPDPRILQAALALLGVEPRRALHVGDEDADARSASAAGMRFERAPLAEAIDRLQ